MHILGSFDDDVSLTRQSLRMKRRKLAEVYWHHQRDEGERYLTSSSVNFRSRLAESVELVEGVESSGF
jgi:hypothetical protein